MLKIICYTRSRSNYNEKQITVTEDYDLQYNEKHIVEKVKVGETDLIKEVRSHVDEVGLQNVIAMAIAHGEDPMTKFAKTGSGVGVSIDPNTTKDELEEMLSSSNSKKIELAKTLGITVAEFDKALESGTLDQLISKVSEVKPEEKEGEE